MADSSLHPLLALIKERNLIDDLQLEEVIQEQARSGKNYSQILIDFQLVDLDTQLQVMAEHLGTTVSDLHTADPPTEVLNLVPPAIARMYQCVPVAIEDGVVQVAFADPLNPSLLD